MVTEGGWMRSSADQVQRYRQAVSSGFGEEAAILVARARNQGLAILGRQLGRAPRGWWADHPGIDLLRYRTLFAASRVPAGSLASGPACLQAVTENLRLMRPLTEWLAEHVGPRRAH
jgi:uncharacterized protein (DUF2461 family)